MAGRKAADRLLLCRRRVRKAAHLGVGCRQRVEVHGVVRDGSDDLFGEDHGPAAVPDVVIRTRGEQPGETVLGTTARAARLERIVAAADLHGRRVRLPGLGVGAESFPGGAVVDVRVDRFVDGPGPPRLACTAAAETAGAEDQDDGCEAETGSQARHAGQLRPADPTGGLMSVVHASGAAPASRPKRARKAAM